MRYCAVVSYFGKNYVGWQRQLNGISVQEVLEKALSKTFNAPVTATASGRTDAGVHAEGQAVHFDVDTSIPCEKIPFAVNTELPSDVSMLSCKEVASDFNARFSAKRKTYRYSMYVARHRRPLLDLTAVHIVVPLNISEIKKCAAVIQGTHDFKAFEASGSVIKNTVRTVYKIDIDIQGDIEGDVLKEGTLNISVTGNGFLYNMVRIIAGTIVYAGMGKLSAEDVVKAIELGERTLVGKTLPPECLTLISVEYEGKG